MISLLLLCALQTTPLPQVRMEEDSVTIFGTCWDISTGVNLKANLTALIKGKTVKVGESSPEGTFDLKIPTSTESMTFEVKGYRSISLPVHIQGKTKKTDRFKFAIRMISVDSQQVAKTFQQENTNLKKETKLGKNTYFEVKDAYTGQPVTARVCLQYSNKKLNECFDMDNSKIPKGLVLPKNDNASITVTAKGFYNYSGNLLPASQDSANALYHIKLLQSQSPVSIFFDGPKNLDISYMFGRNNRFSTEFAFKKGQHIENISLDYINLPVVPGQYEVVVSTGGQKDSTSDELNMEILLSGMKKTGGIVLLTDRFTVSSGLNFKAIHVENPLPVIAANVVHQDDEAKPPFENRTLYFDQSSYLIRSESRLTLDSISEFLRNQRKAKAMITGHTDNVGRRDLNLVLSEYRARVVAHYLKQKGVQPQQISMTYKGPDMPAAPNTDQEKKIKNRRVEIRVGKL